MLCEPCTATSMLTPNHVHGKLWNHRVFHPDGRPCGKEPIEPEEDD